MKFVSKNYANLISFCLLILLLTLLIPAEETSLNAQWIRQYSGTDEKLSDVVMLDSITAIAVGRGRSILRTTDAGKTWENTTNMLSSVVPWNSVSFCNDTMGIAAGDAQLRITFDRGTMWLFRDISVNRKFTSALFINPDDIYVGDDSGWVHHSSDTARTWFSEKISETPIVTICKPPDLEVVYALTWDRLYFREGESEWKELSAGQFFNGIFSIATDAAFSEEGIAFVSGVQGDFVPQAQVLRLRPQDSTWLSVLPFEIGELHSISVPVNNVIYTCGTGGLILSSKNNGDNWISHNLQTKQNLNSIFFFNSTRGFAVGDSGTILYTENNGGVEQKFFTARYWFSAADSFCKTIRKEAAIRNISSENVSADGKSLTWSYKFLWYDQPNNRPEHLYFHNDQNKIMFDSISIIPDCCVQNILEEWFDSDSALAIAEESGGKEFRKVNPDYLISASLYQALVPDSHPSWCITYQSKNDSTVKFRKCFNANKSVTPIEEGSLDPNKFILYQNYPNPFNPVTKIKYTISTSGNEFVTVKVYDVLGLETTTLVNKEQSQGEYEIEFNGSQYSSGVYFYILTAGVQKISRKMILLR